LAKIAQRNRPGLSGGDLRKFQTLGDACVGHSPNVTSAVAAAKRPAPQRGLADHRWFGRKRRDFAGRSQ
jgi:hypothetical protein